MKVLDLFSGIGGISLGLERAGMRTVAFCEIDPFCRGVLRKHWPEVPIHDDVRTLKPEPYVGAVDVMCGGFPCQDVSAAGNRAGIDGARSGLWREFARLVRAIRPRFVVVENAPGLLVRGMGDVLGDLAACGYDAEWQSIPAAALGADHVRERVWLVAYSDRGRREIFRVSQPRRFARQSRRFPDRRGFVWQLDNAPQSCTHWQTEPEVGRLAHGVSGRVARLTALGNAVVPQVAEVIGRAIMAAA